MKSRKEITQEATTSSHRVINKRTSNKAGNQWNVYDGSGGSIQRNRQYRHLISRGFPNYRKAVDDCKKGMISVAEKKAKQQEITDQIYQEIIGNGGSFYDKEGDVKGKASAEKKIMKSLKDRRKRCSPNEVQATTDQTVHHDEMGLFDEAFLDDLASEAATLDNDDLIEKTL